ncbi:hypothetical protein HD806DRAFT_544604 [Xylariaceae sp. AK1471]|nr:hypothetical protein HD806DRAFT_544604 [Xylariaceae sp. AK1471]
MAPNSNPGLAEDDLERGGSRSRDTSYSTKAVQDITYKIIPFCGFCLVVFSVGAILTSTLAFDKPIPHQATLVISLILLSFFLLFCIGFMYLYFRKFNPHTTKHSSSTARPQRGNQPRRRPWKSGRKFARRFARLFSHAASFSSKSSHAASRGVGDSPIRTDTLRDPAPSPNTVRRASELPADVTEGWNVLQDLGGSANQQNRHLAQQRDRLIDELSRIRVPNTVRQGDPGAEGPLNAREPDGSIQANVAFTSHPERTHIRPGSRATQEYSIGSPAVGDGARTSFAAGDRHYTASPKRDTRGSRSRRPVSGRPQKTNGRGFPSQSPSISPGAPVSAPPLSSGSTAGRTTQLRAPVIRPNPGSVAQVKSQARNGDRRHYHHNDASPMAHARVAGPRKMSTQAQRESLKPVFQYYMYSDSPLIPDKTADWPSVPSQLRPAVGQHALSAHASPAPSQARVEDKAQSAQSKYQPLYGRFDIDVTEDMKKLEAIGRRKDQKKPQAVRSGTPSMNSRGEPNSFKASIQNHGKNPPMSRPADSETSYQKDDDMHVQRRRISLDTAESIDAVNQGLSIPSPASRSSPIPGHIQGFNPQYFPAAPMPLSLVPKNRPKGTDRVSSDYAFDTNSSYNPLSYKLEMKQQLLALERRTGQRSPSNPCRPSIYEDEEQAHEKETPENPVQTQDQEQTKGHRGSSRQDAPVRPRGGGRGFGMRIPNPKWESEMSH